MLVASSLTGCASVTDGITQRVLVEARNAAGPVLGAACTLKNTNGTYQVTAPGTVDVSRDSADMQVNCEKSGLPGGNAVFKSRIKGHVAANLLSFGPIGAGIDMISGAGYDYPYTMQVVMGTGVPTMPVPAGSAPTAGPLAISAGK